MNVTTTTDIHIHDRAGKMRVLAHGTSLWVTVPLSTDGTANVIVFLEAAHAVQLGAELERLAGRIQAAQAALSGGEAA